MKIFEGITIADSSNIRTRSNTTIYRNNYSSILVVFEECFENSQYMSVINAISYLANTVYKKFSKTMEIRRFYVIEKDEDGYSQVILKFDTSYKSFSRYGIHFQPIKTPWEQVVEDFEAGNPLPIFG